MPPLPAEAGARFEAAPLRASPVQLDDVRPGAEGSEGQRDDLA
jgi:hypothetical protein